MSGEAHHIRAAAFVATVAAVVRGAVLLATPRYRPLHDDASYARVAASLLAHGRYPSHLVASGIEPSTYRPPAWPMLLAALWAATGSSIPSARILLVVLGVAGCLLGLQLTRALAGSRAGVAAGLLLAVHPLLLALGATLESETLFTTLALAAITAGLHARGPGGHTSPSVVGGTSSRDHRVAWAIAAGVLVGAAALTRANGIALVPVIAWIVAGGRSRPAMLRSGVAGVAAVLVIAPWTVRNAEAVHRFIPVSSETGNTLAGTYNQVSMRNDARWLEPTRTGAYRSLYHRFGAGAALDAALVPAVGRWVIRHPTYPFVVSAENARRLLGFAGTDWAVSSLRATSLSGSAGAVVGAATGLVSLLALAGLAASSRTRSLAPLWCVAAVLLLSAAPVNGELRLGGPVQAILACLAGVTLADALSAHERMRHRRLGSQWHSTRPR